MKIWTNHSASRPQDLRLQNSSYALEALAVHLSRHVTLDECVLEAVRQLPVVVRDTEKGRYLAREDEAANSYILLLAGYTCRHKMTFEGARQIVSFQVSGEAVSSASMFLHEFGTSTQALCRVKAAYIPAGPFRALVDSSPAIRHALQLMASIEGSIANEWLLNIGQRPGKARVAHLLCEIASRLDAAGLSEAVGYRFLLTQDQMGDALGLTAIHINRMLKELRDEGLITRTGQQMFMPDREALERVGDFSDRYLHIQPLHPLRLATAAGQSIS